ncbi:MAG: energy-coupling factor ABC transporter permease [Wenzhouxiangellaceae bacterium]|nr:energy-coupling factor ABC transporter permease [Wenzhouxiangellaceae bacterium]
MNIPAEFIPAWLAWAALLLFTAFFAWNATGAPWKLLHRNLMLPAYFGAVVLMTGLWWMKAESQTGLGLHFLGITSMVLIFGWRLALVGTAAALLSLTAAGHYDWIALGVNGMISVAMPVLLAARLHAFVRQAFPKHYFVYVIVSAHFASMALIAAVVATSAMLLWLVGAYPLDRIANDYLVFLPIAMLPEGFLNGAVLSMLTAWKPEWVRSFDDRDYIDGK